VPVTVVVGGQFGSEGKGKVAHAFAKRSGASFAVRVGGSNSGHTAVDESGKAQIFRCLPTAALLPDVTCVLPAGSYIEPKILCEEIARINLPAERLVIDPNAVIISDEHKEAESRERLRERLGSTGSGTGAALVHRIQRRDDLRRAVDDPLLRDFVHPTTEILREALDKHQRVILEGTQGFGLSVLHSPYYPKATSRDTTAAAFVSEAGLSPLDVDEIVMVIRAFPIRVSGDSGPLPKEIDWETVTREGGHSRPIKEMTSATDRIRRVANFDETIVKSAIKFNIPSALVLNHVDYLSAKFSRGSSNDYDKFVSKIEYKIGQVINWIGLGPNILVKRNKNFHVVASGS
jgi:adenylosuccinate synthase